MRTRGCRRFGPILLAFGLVSGAAGCGGSTPSPARDQVVMSLLNDPVTLDPATTNQIV